MSHDPLLRALLGPGRPELTCEECFDELDVQAEVALQGLPLDARMQAHLDGCPACREDFESLMAYLGASPA